MRTLTIADNWKDWKFGDTDAVMTFTALDDDKVPDFSDRTLTFKIASTLNNDLEHPKDFAATATGYIQDKNVILKTEDVKQLTPGNYIVELWAMSNDTQKDAVYPSKGFAQFTIEENSMKVSDVTNIPSMTINAFWDAVMQKVRTLTKGAKGDPGKTPKIVIGSVTKLSPDAQPSATLVPLQSDPNTYTLNLQLPQGVQGEQGLQGIPGVGSKGLNGNNGLTPTIDPKTKHWMIGGTDTGVIAEGQAGKDADPSKYVTIVSFNQLRQQVQSNATALAQKAGKFELEDKLAQMSLEPEAFENETALKAKYPAGASGLMVTVDTGHKWLWINGAWKDCGIYQAAGVDDAIATRITAATEQTKHGFDKELDQETTDRIADDQQLRSDLDGLATIKNAVELKDIDLLDDDGNPLTDQDGQHVTVQNYLPKTDMIGNQKGLPIDSSLVGDTFLSNLTKYGLPVLYLDDDRVFGLQTKKDKLSDVPYHWVNAPGDLKGEGLIKKLKVQGNSSSTFPKKSYKFTLDNPGTAKVGWVSSDEYAVKAYWADFSHLRDIGVSHLWAQMRRDRITAENSVLISDDGALSDQSGNALAVETDPSLTAGTTFGTIDGFPIFLVIDGKYNGFYDLIIPKSPEMAKMPDRHSTTHRAIISAEGGDICGFMQEPALNDDGTLDDGNGWSIEFVQNENDQKWVGDAFKKLYDVISADYANADDFTAAVSPYVDLDSAIDLWLLVIATQSNDEVTHNFLMQTYDGKKWYFAPYDNDITFGLNDWHGTKVQKANTSNAWIGSRQKLWGQLIKHCADKIKARWDALRSPRGALSELNVWYVINTLAMALPVGVYEAESKRWPAIPGTATKDASQIITYYDLWIKKQDEFIAKY